MDGPKLSNYSISPTTDPEGLTVSDIRLFFPPQHESCIVRMSTENNFQKLTRIHVHVIFVLLDIFAHVDFCFTQKVLTDALGMVGQVKKERHLFMVGQTRVHVDTVEGLGHFMELEVCKPSP